MYNFRKWLDHWVKEQQRAQSNGVGVLRVSPRRVRRFPDDPQDDPSDISLEELCACDASLTVGDSSGSYISVPTTGVARDFSHFWMQHRAQPELYNLSLKAARCLLGAREKRFTGFLAIRDDLPSSWYLEVPFIRRCWRLLWILDEHEQGDYDSGVPAIAPIPARPGGFPGLSFSWSLIRDLDLNPATAQVTMRAMLELLIEADMLDPAADGERYLTDRAGALISVGSPGAFFKSLCIRAFNRCVWDREDGLPPLVSIQLNGLYLLYVMHARFRGSTGFPGTSAWQLGERLDFLNRLLRMDSDHSFWSRDKELMTRAIQLRFLNGIGRILGLVEPVVDGEEKERGQGSAALPGTVPYRPTPFAERVMLWNP